MTTTTTTIITDYKWKAFKYRYEVPAKVLKSDFEHLTEDDHDHFIQYRHRWYHLSDFMSLTNSIHCPNPPKDFKGYDGYHSDSFFSGILIKISDDGECYQIATYIS